MLSTPIFGRFALSLRSKSISIGMSVGYAKSLGVTKSETSSETKTITLTKTDYSLEQTKEKIEAQIARLQNGSSLGMWRFATYILSKDYTVSNNVANMYLSLTQGDESYVECSATNSWNVNRNGYGRLVDTIKRREK